MDINDSGMKTLCETVQHNCNVTDARHASDYSMCTYLMKMREYCRWEKGYGFNDKMTAAEVGRWLDERERLWDDLREQETDYQPLTLDERLFEPFDSEAVNQKLNRYGYVYSGGMGARSTPHFFLAKLTEQKQWRQHKILISGHEYARDLAAAPAMRLGNTIFIRHQSLRRMLWEKYCEWNWNKSHQALGKAFSFYPCESNVEEALQTMTLVEANTALLHEIGEFLSAELLGETWREMLSELPRSRAEIALRAVKDLMADCLHTLPELIKEQKIPSLYFYFANLSGMRKVLAPSLQKAAKDWYATQDGTALLDVVQASAQHWRKVAQAALRHYRQKGAEAPVIAELLEEKTF